MGGVWDSGTEKYELRWESGTKVEGSEGSEGWAEVWGVRGEVGV